MSERYIKCPCCSKEIVLLEQKPTVITLEEYNQQLRAELDADKARRKAILKEQREAKKKARA
jgi:hypothetical protein